MLDLESDFSKYRLLILPDAIPLDPERGFVFDVGAKWHGLSPYRIGDYLLPIEPLRASFVGDPLFMYEVAQRIKVKGGKSLGAVYDPFSIAPHSISAVTSTRQAGPTLPATIRIGKGRLHLSRSPDLHRL